MFFSALGLLTYLKAEILSAAEDGEQFELFNGGGRNQRQRGAQGTAVGAAGEEDSSRGLEEARAAGARAEDDDETEECGLLSRR